MNTQDTTTPELNDLLTDALEPVAPRVLSGQASPDQIIAWKNTYGDVFEIEVDDLVAYVKAPDRKTVGFASAPGLNPIRSNEILLKGCWLGGDERIKNDDTYFLSVQPQLRNILELKQVQVKKL